MYFILIAEQYYENLHSGIDVIIGSIISSSHLEYLPIWMSIYSSQTILSTKEEKFCKNEQKTQQMIVENWQGTLTN